MDKPTGQAAWPHAERMAASAGHALELPAGTTAGPRAALVAGMSLREAAGGVLGHGKPGVATRAMTPAGDAAAGELPTTTHAAARASGAARAAVAGVAAQGVGWASAMTAGTRGAGGKASPP